MTTKLAAGLERLPAEQRALQIDYFHSQQQPDGGFAGRGGTSDLYYTGFALRALAILGGLEMECAGRIGEYLSRQMQSQVAVIDLISLVFAARLLEATAGIEVFSTCRTDWATSVADSLEKLRRPADGGYAKSDQGQASSTYHTFLIALAYELLETPLPEPVAAVRFLLGQQREDGGFVEIRVMRRSGTNPTAAAIGALRLLQTRTSEPALTPELVDQVARFLATLQNHEGGLRANTQIPLADLLSTFTGLQTLDDLGQIGNIDWEAGLSYVRSLAAVQGGFRAAAWDDAVDVEYSFYGLAALGLLLPRCDD